MASLAWVVLLPDGGNQVTPVAFRTRREAVRFARPRQLPIYRSEFPESQYIWTVEDLPDEELSEMKEAQLRRLTERIY